MSPNLIKVSFKGGENQHYLSNEAETAAADPSLQHQLSPNKLLLTKIKFIIYFNFLLSKQRFDPPAFRAQL